MMVRSVAAPVALTGHGHVMIYVHYKDQTWAYMAKDREVHWVRKWAIQFVLKQLEIMGVGSGE